MKKSLLFALAVGMMASCTNDKIETIDDSKEAVIKLSVESTGISVKENSRALGSLKEWKNSEVFIYAFEKGETDFTNAAPITTLDGKKAIVGSGDEAPIQWAAPNDYEEKYPETGEYDFFGYYIDDAAVSGEIRETEKIYFDIEIDGSQDLMIAKAKLKGDENLDPTVEDKIYSAYTARRGVHPHMIFEHLLTRLEFHIVPGGEGAENVSIESIEVESFTKGEMVVVATDDEDRGLFIDESEEKVFLSLKEENSLGQGALVDLTSGYYIPATYENQPGATQQTMQVGESLLVAPDEAYQVRVQMKQAFDGNDLPATYSPTLKLSGTDVFEAGKEYTVTITVYGPEQIDITAKLSEWQDGGSVNLDPEKDNN